ncbi:MAG: AlpA family phage regulatory protein [Betaproteobacteria bacterium]|nr:AlpA family phage regulatory protein [Betaproteobacteria bacterium]
MNKQSAAAVAAFTTLPDNGLVPVDAAAVICALGISTIWRRVKDGRFPAPIKVQRSTRWRAGDLRAWLQAQG